MKTLYLAECSQTYQILIPKLIGNRFSQIVNLWEDPNALIAADCQESLLIIDEAFLWKGPGPACTTISSLLDEQRIVLTPMILLERREKSGLVRLNTSRVRKLRRPFRSKDLESILSEFYPHLSQEQNMESVPIVVKPQAEDYAKKIKFSQPLPNLFENLDEETLKTLVQEVIENMVREIVPPLAEKIIREEIKLLTELDE